MRCTAFIAEVAACGEGVLQRQGGLGPIEAQQPHHLVGVRAVVRIVVVVVVRIGVVVVARVKVRVRVRVAAARPAARPRPYYLLLTTYYLLLTTYYLLLTTHLPHILILQRHPLLPVLPVLALDHVRLRPVKQGGTGSCRLAGSQKLLWAPERASACPKLRPASASQPLGPRWPAIQALGSTCASDNSTPPSPSAVEMRTLS